MNKLNSIDKRNHIYIWLYKKYISYLYKNHYGTLGFPDTNTHLKKIRCNYSVTKHGKRNINTQFKVNVINTLMKV